MINKKFFFTVKGSGKFPTAALAANQAWPLDHRAAHRITMMVAFPEATPQRRVKLVSALEPNPELWAGYGYQLEIDAVEEQLAA